MGYGANGENIVQVAADCGIWMEITVAQGIRHDKENIAANGVCRYGSVNGRHHLSVSYPMHNLIHITGNRVVFRQYPHHLSSVDDSTVMYLF